MPGGVGIRPSRAGRPSSTDTEMPDDSLDLGPDEVVAFTEKQRRYIVETLRRGAPDFQIGDIISEKIPAQLYIDDKAVGFRGDWEDTFAEAIRIMG